MDITIITSLITALGGLGLVNFWTAYQAQWGEVGAAMIMASIPVLIIYLFFSNQIADAMSASGMKN